MPNWNVDETPYPGPAYDFRPIYMKRDTYWNLEVTGSFQKITIEGLDISRRFDINDAVEVINFEYDTVFEGFVNSIEIESSFLGRGPAITRVVCSNKLIAPSFGYD